MAAFGHTGDVTRFVAFLRSICGRAASMGFRYAVVVVLVLDVALIVAAKTGRLQVVTFLSLLVVMAVIGFRADFPRVVVCCALALAGGLVAVAMDAQVSSMDGLQSLLLLTGVATGAHLLARSFARRIELERLRAELTSAESRAALSRDVHDITSHALMAVVTQLRVAKQGLRRGDPEPSRRGLDAAEQASLDALRELRGLTAVLAGSQATASRLTSTDTLFAELQRLCGGIAGAHFVANPTAGEVVDEHTADAAIRIVQQCLANAAAHSPGAAVTVGATIRDGVLLLSSSNPATEHDSPGLGMGIAIMQRRAAEQGGRLVVARPQGSFRIECELPLTEAR